MVPPINGVEINSAQDAESLIGGLKRKEKDLLREALLAEVNSGIKPDIFCGIAIDQFTPTQKVLFDKLSAREIKKLSQNITINKAQGQIEFSNVKLAIKDKDLERNCEKKYADKAIVELGDGWELPRDMDYSYEKQGRLDPDESDYDAMILQIPGIDIKEKIVNFALLTDMGGVYRTKQNYNNTIGLSSKSVIRDFSKKDRGPHRDLAFDVSGCHHVRPVKRLP